MCSGLIIIGAGTQAKLALDTCRLQGTPVQGIVATHGVPDWLPDDLPVLGALADLERVFANAGASPLLVTGSDNRFKQEVVARLAALEPAYAGTVHPSAVISGSATIGKGTIVNALAVVQPFARVGDHVVVHAGAIVEHDCAVADFANLAPRATLAGHVKVGTGATVFSGATVTPGVSIGAHAIVGAGSVVLQDVPAGATVAGVPARVIRDVAERQAVTAAGRTGESA